MTGDALGRWGLFFFCHMFFMQLHVRVSSVFAPGMVRLSGSVFAP